MVTTSPSSSARVAPAQLLDPKVLARIGNLELLSRRVVDGFLSGLHRTLLQGSSTEFGQYREYIPGDDVRHIDWKLFARTDRLYLKTFEAESNADVIIALDQSASMAYASQGEDDAPPVSKFDYARFAAASLAHLSFSQRDRVGLALLDDDVARFYPPSGRRREALLVSLAQAEAQGAGNLEQALERLAKRLARRGIVVLLSDFYLSPEDAVGALDVLRLRGHDVLALHVLDPAERRLDALGADGMVLEDMESGDRLPVVPSAFRDAYASQVQAHIDALETKLGARRIDYACVTTDTPLDGLLFRFLSERARRRLTRN